MEITQTDPLDPRPHPARPSAVVIVAHPDDETIWAGGTILSCRDYDWSVYSLCRRDDPDRAPKFLKVLERLGARGSMGNLEDGPDQTPLADDLVSTAVMNLLPHRDFDLILTHGPAGEYRRHRRHEETCRAVAGLWSAGLIRTKTLWTFAYLYDEEKRISVPDPAADIALDLPDNIYAEKHLIMKSLYGFEADSFEVKTISHSETYRVFENPQQFREKTKGAQPI